MGKEERAFFSVSFELILTEKDLPYDLYVNSSTHKVREKYVRIFASGNSLKEEDLAKFKKKYHQLYVPEEQRSLYLSSLTQCKQASLLDKSKVVKESAIHYLNDLFERGPLNTDYLEVGMKGMQEVVHSMVDTLHDCSISQVQELIGDLSFHDFYTYDHSINVAMYNIVFYRSLRPKAKRLELVMAGMGGLLHDIGKVKISTKIINNPDKLTEEEFEVIKLHPNFGAEVLSDYCCHKGEDAEEFDFEVIKRVVYEHHENFNGTGYPQKIEGNDIHVLARITAISDFFDALTTKRSYHQVLKTEDALKIMEKSAGRKIDPKLFAAFRSQMDNVLFAGKSNQVIDDDFDPCRPQNVLPLRREKSGVHKQDVDLFKKDEDYGHVTVDKPSRKKKAS